MLHLTRTIIRKRVPNSLPLTYRLRPKWLVLVGLAAMGLAAAKAACADEGKAGGDGRPRPRRIGHATQLFVDDVLIHRREGIVRRVQPGTKMDRPVMVSEHPWEFSYHPQDDGIGKRIYVYGTVFFDPLQKQYRMWYMSRMSRRHDYSIPELEIPDGGNVHCDLTLYAGSKDGIRWERPNLGLCHFNGSDKNNIMLDFHGASVILDQEEPDPQKRYKAIGFVRRFKEIRMCHSADGIHWSDPQPAGDRKNEGSFNVCYVPSLGCYVAGSIERSGDARYEFKNWEGRRGRKRVALALMTDGKDLTKWVHRKVIYPDDKDDPNTQFYGMTPLAYSDLVLGFLHVFHYTGPGPANDDGPIAAQLVYSRDGRTWHRLEDRRPVIPVGPKNSFDGGMIMMTANGAFVHGDELIAYYTAANTTHGALIKDRTISIGRASWRRDRLVALQAGAQEGAVETVLLEAPAGRLEVNADATGGRVTVEVLDAEGQVQPGLSSAQCVPILDDGLGHPVRWKGRDPPRIQQPFRLRILLKNAKLFSFRFVQEK